LRSLKYLATNAIGGWRTFIAQSTASSRYGTVGVCRLWIRGRICHAGRCVHESRRIKTVQRQVRYNVLFNDRLDGVVRTFDRRHFGRYNDILVAEPAVSAIGSVATCPTVSTIPLCSYFEKRSFETRITYEPTGTDVTRNEPSGPETVSVVRFVCV
jgi:hypothetical protein